MSSVGSSLSDASSHSSFSTGTGGSVISNSNSDVGALAKLSAGGDQDASIQDLLQQNKGLWDAAFSCLLLLTKNRAVTGYRMLAFRTVFEYLQMFRLVFNTRFLWVIHTDLWVWKVFYWVLFRFLVWDLGYGNYVMGCYVICSVVLAMAVATIVIAVVLRKDDTTSPWLKRVVWLLQNGALLVFSTCWVSVLDYMAFMFTCAWGATNTHVRWPAADCTAMPHLASMVFAGVTLVIFVVIGACLAMAECSGNLVSDNLMASPVAETALKTTALKVVIVGVSTCLDQFPKPQAVLMFICPCLSAYFQISSSPYLLPWMNHLWTGLWAALVYTTSLLLTLNYYRPEEPWDLEQPDVWMAYREQMTWAVLYGIFPAVLAGAGLNWLVHRWKTRPVTLFEQAQQEADAGRLHLESAAVLKGIYRFHSPEQVAFLARCVRRLDPVTDMVLPEAAALCSLIIQAGLARFPNHPTILMLYANYIIHVKKEPRAARQQLQLASKGEPGLIDRYNIFAANDVLKRNRNDSDGGLDLMAYVEFQRNYRACVKAHKTALLAQRAFWRSLMHDSLKLSSMLASLKAMEGAEQTAVYVYKRVMERYPQNGKLLKAYGRFQEWVLHDPARAARSYGEAIKRGLGDNLLNLTSDDADTGAVDSRIDEKLDGVVIIDAGGSILMANKVAYRMFGYTRGEMDNKNVNILMPQPFSSRHDSYLSNFLTTGVAKILNSQRSVVAVCKDRSIFPLALTVTRLSGMGQESVFMGVMRVTEDEDSSMVRAWCTPTGTILCCDAKLGEWFGVPPAELTGRPISSLGQQPEAIEGFVQQAMGPSRAAAAAGKLRLETSLTHKYLQSISVEVTTAFGGTDEECILQGPGLMLRIRCLNEAERLMVVDDHQRIVYASDTLAKLVGTSSTALAQLSLHALIPAPAAQLHKRWMTDMGGTRPAPGSCRSGAVVQLVGVNGARVPVRLAIKTVEQATADRVERLHIVQVHKATTEQQLDDERVSLTVDHRGVVLDASHSPKALFGFDPPTDLAGRSLASFINMFEDFRVQNPGRQGSSGSQQGGAAGGGAAAAPSQHPQQRYSQLALQVGPGPEHHSGSGSGAVAPAAGDDAALLTILAQAAQEGSDACYRVGVRAHPIAEERVGMASEQELQQQSAATSSVLLAALGGCGSHRLRPALMRVDVVETDWTCAGGGAVLFKVQLWSVEHLRAALELDARLKVAKSDPAMPQMLGLPPSALNRKLLGSVLRLPGHIKEASDLLRVQGQGGHQKASALKTAKAKAAKEARVGPLLEVEAGHADGQPVRLQLQAVAKEGQASRTLLLVRLAQPASTGLLQALLQLAGAAGASKPPKALLAHAGVAAAAGSRSIKQPAAGAGAVAPKARAAAGLGPGSSGGSSPVGSHADPQEHPRLAARLPGARSGRAAAFAAADEEDEQGGERGRDHGQRSRKWGAGGRGGSARWQAGDMGDAGSGGSGGGGGGIPADWGQQPGSPRRRGAGGSRPAWDTSAAGATAAGTDVEASSWDDGEGEPGGRRRQPRLTGQDSGLPEGSDGGGPAPSWQRLVSLPGGPGRGGGGGGFVPPPPPDDPPYGGGFEALGAPPGGGRGSVAGGQPSGDGGSDAGSDDEGSKLDIGSASEAGDGEMGDEDVTCDWRRAKRLRRILKQLDSPVARAPLLRFWRGTWGVVGMLVLAHVVCYAVLSAQVNSRNTDVYGVQQLANAVDKSQMLLLRANFIAKCGFPEFQAWSVCSASQRALYLAKSMSNAAALETFHHAVFLGKDASAVMPLRDPTLLDWWVLPIHEEWVFYDTNPPTSTSGNISLWNLGNRYVRAADELNFAAKAGTLVGPAMENLRFWQYLVKNGKDSLYNAYSVSLDLYVLFCWSQLGGLAGLLTGLLVAELVVVAIAAMVFQLDLVRRVCKQRMACYSVFLALPSATLRTMATAPCQVDEDDEGSEADDDLDMLEAGPVAGEDQGQGQGQGQGQDAAAAGTGSMKVNKSVRMSVQGDAADGKAKSSRPGKLLAGKKQGKGADAPGLLGWCRRKAKIARHAMRGILNRTMKINGKKLQPARATFASFMLPLLCWWVVAVAIFGVSFKQVDMLQAPLTSLQAASHVQFMIARTRMLANLLGFLPDDADHNGERAELNTALVHQLQDLRAEYATMLYGGLLTTSLPGAAPVHTTAALFRDPKIAWLFFQTTDCIRVDKTGCFQPGSMWFDVSHTGIDAMVQRFLQEVSAFAMLPPAAQTANTSHYEYTWRVAANDLYDGLGQASDIFVGTTLNALQQLEQLHTYLLVASLALFACVAVALLLPFKRRLVMESVRLAGLLSQLPQESDVEGQVKLLVLDAASGHKPGDAATSRNWSLARGVTAAAAAAARAAASRAAGAVGNLRARMAESAAASSQAAAQAAAGGGWQPYDGDGAADAASDGDDGGSSAPEWE